MGLIKCTGAQVATLHYLNYHFATSLIIILLEQQAKSIQNSSLEFSGFERPLSLDKKEIIYAVYLIVQKETDSK